MASGAAAQAPATDSSETLHLECPGEAIRTSTITDADDNDVSIDQKFSASVEVEISGGAGRVRLPGKLVPLLSSSSDNWFDLSDLKIEPDRITARFRVSFISRPSLEIDRRSGNIRIEGHSHFYGRCDRAATTNRF
jgi:hypothetical protein